MSYQVFARKYRPQRFEDVLGQDHVVRTLRNAIEQDRLAHAYLFVGPRGTGKTSTARILAKALNCPGGPKIDFDPDDELCREIAEGRSLDVLEIDGASNNGVEQVRDLRESVKFAPARAPYKIYYIDEVHMLSSAAFNALLKTLEEPPPHVKFIFATTEPTKILPTIISRCQRFDLRRIPDKIIADHLQFIAQEEGVKLDDLAAFAIAKGAEGGMRDAQSMMDQLVAFCGNEISEQDVLNVFGFTAHQVVADLAGFILGSDTAGALNALHAQADAGKDLSRLLDDLIGHFRNLLVFKTAPETASKELAPEIAETLASQSESAKTDRLLAAIDQLAEADARMKWAPNKRLHFELGIIKAIGALQENSLSDVINALAGAAGIDPAAAVPTAGAAGAAAPPPARRTTSPSPAAASAEPPPSRRPRPRDEAASGSAGESDSAAAGAGAAAAAEPAAPAPIEAMPDGASADLLWARTLEEFTRQKPLAASWAQAAHPVLLENRALTLGFSPEDGLARDSLGRPNMKSAIEEILSALSGRSMSLKLVVDDSVAPMEHPEIEDDDDEPPPPAASAAAAPSPIAAKAPPPALSPEAIAAASDEGDDDPEIQEALRLFEATRVQD